MSVYTIHEPPHPPADRLDRAERMVFVRDGFSWGVFLLGPIWLIARSQWIALALYVAAASSLAGLLKFFEAGEVASPVVFLALNLFAAFELGSLQRFLLDRAGWQEIGSVSGRNSQECERRFFETWLPLQPAISGPGPHMAAGTLAAGAGIMDGPVASNGWRRLFSRKA